MMQDADTSAMRLYMDTSSLQSQATLNAWPNAHHLVAVVQRED